MSNSFMQGVENMKIAVHPTKVVEAQEFEPHLAGAQLLAGSMFQHHYRLRGMLTAASPNLVRIYHIDWLMRPTSILQGVEQEARRLTNVFECTGV
jgi:hypothetical protein